MFGNWFKKSSFGIYISGDTLKLVELVRKGGKLQVSGYGEHKIWNGRLPEMLDSLKNKLGLKSAHLSLAAVHMDNLPDYLSAFKNSGIEIKSFETGAEALARALLPAGDLGTYMLVEFGNGSHTLFVVSGGTLGLVSSFNFGENILASKDEVQKHFLNWHLEKEDLGTKPLIKKIIITGADHDLPKLAEYLAVSLRNKVEVGNVWINILDTQKEIPAISLEDSFTFAAPLGLALKEFIIDPLS